jgi:hypothetical protein
MLDLFTMVVAGACAIALLRLILDVGCDAAHISFNSNSMAVITCNVIGGRFFGKRGTDESHKELSRHFFVIHSSQSSQPMLRCLLLALSANFSPATI